VHHRLHTSHNTERLRRDRCCLRRKNNISNEVGRGQPFIRKVLLFFGAHISISAEALLDSSVLSLLPAVPWFGPCFPFIFRCCPPDISSINDDHDELFGLPVSYGEADCLFRGSVTAWPDYVILQASPHGLPRTAVRDGRTRGTQSDRAA
jgi:hypothetical protein